MYLQLDSQMGTTTRVPRLLHVDGFTEWKWHFKNHAKFSYAKIWRSIQRGKRVPMYVPDGCTTRVPKPIEEYTDDDFDMVEQDDKALASLTMALGPDIAQGFKECTSAKELWEALIQMYEGNNDIKESRRDMLNQRFNMFNHVLGESLETQLQRFVCLITEMRGAEIFLSNGEINKKLLNSLPRSWDMNVALIKKTKDLYRISLIELISIIKSYDMDDKQRTMNHNSSLSVAGVGNSNNAFISQSSTGATPVKSHTPARELNVAS
ncbi:hypothetical protein E3N88_12011 [Mikania micrantha]|uniref:Uncharacterized protein n=1 Tax=Mikania micrantha TaxID=192012 RepID=A0A5N6P4L7_9ASTR|nr:hypothetical protein E3N88_12011 [Mikania micrantha]